MTDAAMLAKLQKDVRERYLRDLFVAVGALELENQIVRTKLMRRIDG